MRTLVLTALCILAGCGTAPPESAPVASSTVLAATPRSTASQPAVPTPQNTASQTAVPADKNRKFKPPAGYKTKIVGWDIVYCRKIVVLGSRFPKEFCMTEAELKAHLARNEEMREGLDQGSRTCSQAAACGTN